MQIIIRGTTPVLRFRFPEALRGTAFPVIQFSLEQSGKMIVRRIFENYTPPDGILEIRLTQRETFRLRDGTNAEVQVRLRDAAGDVYASFVTRVEVRKSLSEEVL